MITYRGKQLNDDMLTTDVRRSDVRYIVAQPGDATRYELMTVALDNTTTSLMHEEPGSMILTCMNLRGDGPVSMFLRPRLLHWTDINNGLGIGAEGSCYFITALLAWMYPSSFSCQTEEQFMESIRNRRGS
jgi:hypothetical protein